MSARFPYCEVFGFNDVAIKARLDLMDMGEKEVSYAKLFHENVLGNKQAQIIDGFYKQMQKKSQFLQILEQGKIDLEALKLTQTHYVNTMGIDFGSMEYFNERLRIGWIHSQVGVPLSLYQAAYRALQELMIIAVCEIYADDMERANLINYILKISNLDMSLAISAYHHTQMNVLQESLENMQTAHTHLKKKAYTDSLTDLPTKETIKTQLSKDLLELYDHRGSVYLIMADLDFFKKINDEYGHLTGDYVLKDVANRIRQSLRDVDMVGRYGGEEFIILLKHKTLEQAQLIAERIRTHIDSSPINANGQSIDVTLSQGLACGYADDSAETLIERADKALYEAKGSGRNCVVTAGS